MKFQWHRPHQHHRESIVSTSTQAQSNSAGGMKFKYKMNEYNKVVMDIKDCICAILLRIDTLRLDYQMSSVLLTLYEKNKTLQRQSQHSGGIYTHSGASSTMSESSKGWMNTLMSCEKVSPLTLAMQNHSLDCRYSLHVLAKRRIDSILLQALMYEHPPLVSKALELLYQQFNQHKQLIKALSNVLLLVNDATVHLYAKLQDDVDNLRRLAETTEVWLDLTSPEDFDTATNACKLLTALTLLLESSEHGVEMHRLMRNLEVLEHIMAMVYAGSHFFKALFPSKTMSQSSYFSQSPTQRHRSTINIGNELMKDQQRKAMRHVFDHCMQFLSHFCRHETASLSNTNTDMLEICANRLIDFVEEIPAAQAALLEIYRGNFNSGNHAVPVEIISHFVQWSAYYKSEYETRYLDFLHGIAQYSQPQSFHARHLILYHVTKFPVLLQMSDDDNVAPQALSFHGHVLHLLAACVAGSLPQSCQAKEICATSFVTIGQWVALMDAGVSNENVIFGFACMRYFKEVFMPLDDFMDDLDVRTHERILFGLSRMLRLCKRYIYYIYVDPIHCARNH
jgi:hypothetical protein